MNTEELNDLNARLDRIERATLIGAKDILTLDETVYYTGFTKAFLYQLTSHGEIPHYKRSRRLYFHKDDINAWLTKNKVMSNEEVERKAETYLVTRQSNARSSKRA